MGYGARQVSGCLHRPLHPWIPAFAGTTSRCAGDDWAPRRTFAIISEGFNVIDILRGNVIIFTTASRQWREVELDA